MATTTCRSASDRPTFWQASFVSVWTSLLFLCVYNATNWISSWRAVTSTARSQAQLDEAVAFIGEHAAEGIVYVHCKIGYSRSAAVLGAYPIASGHADSAHEAMQKLREVRPSIVIRPEAQDAIHRFAARTRYNLYAGGKAPAGNAH